LTDGVFCCSDEHRLMQFPLIPLSSVDDGYFIPFLKDNQSPQDMIKPTSETSRTSTSNIPQTMPN